MRRRESLVRALLACLAVVVVAAQAGCGASSDVVEPDAVEPNAVEKAPEKGAAPEIEGARVVPAGAVAALYATMKSAQDDRLLRVTSPAGGRLELHETVFDGDIVRMQARPGGFELTPGEAFELRAGGPHAMWTGRDFEAGERLPVVLHFENGGAVEATARVEAMTGASGTMADHGDHGGHGGPGGPGGAQDQAAEPRPPSEDPGE